MRRNNDFGTTIKNVKCILCVYMYRYRIYRCGLCLLCDVRARVKPSNTTSQCVRVGDSRLCVRLHDVRVFAQCAIVFAHEYNVI